MSELSSGRRRPKPGRRAKAWNFPSTGSTKASARSGLSSAMYAQISARSTRARGRTTRLGIHFAAAERRAALEELASFAFHFRGAPGASVAAVHAFADVAAQLLQFQ